MPSKDTCFSSSKIVQVWPSGQSIELTNSRPHELEITSPWFYLRQPACQQIWVSNMHINQRIHGNMSHNITNIAQKPYTVLSSERSYILILLRSFTRNNYLSKHQILILKLPEEHNHQLLHRFHNFATVTTFVLCWFLLNISAFRHYTKSNIFIYIIEQRDVSVHISIK